MKRNGSLRVRAFLLLSLCLLLLAGCGKPVPKTLVLDSQQETEAKVLLQRFQEREQPNTLDADMRVGWEAWGRKGSSAAVLQMQRPAYIRFSLNDPLGRPLLILASDGNYFILVDNQEGRGYHGRPDSTTWHEYLPLLPEDLFSLLAGRLQQVPQAEVRSGLDQSGKGFWYSWVDSRMLEHHVLLNRLSGFMDRRLLLDSTGDLALDVSYSSYQMIPDSGLSWPRQLRISGVGIRGNLSLQAEHFYPQQDFHPSIFLLSIPPHFSTEQVQ